MLQWLSSWLREIIAIVLLAGIVDLLLPSKSMQRYVRFVVGLIILLTILTPLLRFFQGDFETSLSKGIESWDENAAQGQLSMPSIDDITAKGQRLADTQQQQAGVLAEAALEKIMKVKIEQQTGAAVESVVLKLGAGAAGAQVIDAVTVKLAQQKQDEEDSTKQDSKGQGEGEIAEVQQVAVGVQVDSQPEQATEEDSNDNSAQMTRTEQALAEQIRSVVVKEWSVDPKHVSVTLAAAAH